MSLLPSADVFRSVELQVSQLHRGLLICPHAPGESCSAGEHLTLSEAKEAAARDAADRSVRDALWRCVGRDAHSDVPDLARRSQLLALYFVVPYLRKSAAKVSTRLCVDVADVRSAMVFGALCGLALATEGDDVRNEVVRAAHAVGWAVARANTAERTTDPHTLVDREGRHGDDYSPIRNESDVHVVSEVDSSLREQIGGERLGATMQHLGILDEFLVSDTPQASEGEPDECAGPEEETQ
ncbi:hypothetical protein TPA0598_02_02330 [Streptomyces lydicamycinicus]|uniref:Uncharacterized protein n=2 Tax=Streptomyces lydicamycinicus TaxID=1546107 RepID=A0A0N7YKU6_9ACTN|nr:hypothetical protein TPA0598_02_02330 [Streptomyces lydicamycinicus]